MSRWTHGIVANSRRNSPLLTSDPSAEPGVLEVAVPAVHLGHVLVDERELPVALAGPVAGGRDRVVEVLGRAEGARSPGGPSARETAPVRVATSTRWVAPSRSA